MRNELSQQQKVLALMIRKHQQQEWFTAPDFMREGMGELFVGYEAGARLSELYTEFPQMIESQPAGNHKKRRLRFENTAEFLPLLPSYMRDFIRNELDRAGISYEIRTKLPYRVEGENAVQMRDAVSEGNPNLKPTQRFL